MEPTYPLTIEQIKKVLPHRSPFLLIDRILNIEYLGNPELAAPHAEVGTRVSALKNVSFNEPYFEGHFPSRSLVPGVLILETMAQTALFTAYPSFLPVLDQISQRLECMLVGVDRSRFRKPVVPGDSMRIETTLTKRRNQLWAFHCLALVDQQKVAEADILANISIQSG